ncbi:hypothetical protein Q5O24_12070 [Eubacteriaceae bacterium ES3]|nr:hypothetical protein Q5O24_12070 [Eubacteriaceae bacterium ES3]
MKKRLLFLGLMMVAFLCIGCSVTDAEGSGADLAFSGNAQLRVLTADGQEWTIDESIMNEAALVSFETTQGKSGEDPETNVHTGVLLKDILVQAGVDVDGITSIQCTSFDGFSKVYSKEDLDDSEKLFLTFEMDGELLTYEDQDCFYIVVKNESFKQNWTKYLMEIEIS